jgi:hypothetical protein
MWVQDVLYASRGYELFSARVGTGITEWQPVATFRPPIGRRITARHRLTSRLFRDGFHALTILQSGVMVAAVPGAIVRLAPGTQCFEISYAVRRGTRPLNLCATPQGRVYWGEYFDNRERDEVHIYGSYDGGLSWQVVHTFPRGAIRHVHNIVYDRWRDCLWILTGDDGSECRILRADPDLKNVETVLQGNQQSRAVALIPREEAVYFSSDTPFESNHVYRLDNAGQLEKVADLMSSSISGGTVGPSLFFSTMAEPSKVNPENMVSLCGVINGESWQNLMFWRKDFWPMRFFQYGNAFFPTGENTSGVLALTTIAVADEDSTTTLWRIP